MSEHPFYPTPEQLRAKQADWLEIENTKLRAALADERRHADALYDTLMLRHNGDSTFWPNALFMEQHHATRRAHDSECESEFDSQVHAQTPCGCAARRAAEKEEGR